MRIPKIVITIVLTACADIALMSVMVVGQSSKSTKTGSALTPVVKKPINQETTGNDIWNESTGVPVDTSIKKMRTAGMTKTGEVVTPTHEEGYWTCIMHPQIHKADSSSCPICGMKLMYKKNDKDTVVNKIMNKNNPKM
jgi:DNA-directed RNA polymerase subunit RPC12/RpoP